MTAIELPEWSVPSSVSMLVAMEVVDGLTGGRLLDLSEVLSEHGGHQLSVGHAGGEGVLLSCDSCRRMFDLTKVPFDRNPWLADKDRR